MFRDIAAMSILLVPFVPAVLFFLGSKSPVALLSGVFFAAQYFLAAVAAKNNGIRFVQNVLAIHATKKLAPSKRAPARTKAKTESND
jgi:uncharacterized membrane protein (UPF0136 family)